MTEIPKTFRQSLLARHDLCPFSAKLMMDYPDRKSIPMDRGTAFHSFVEHAIHTMAEAGEPRMSGEQARELADATMSDSVELVLPTSEQDVVRLMAWNWAQAFTYDPETIIGVEVPLHAEIMDYAVTGTVDLIESVGSTLYVRDWKTSLNIRKTEEVKRGFQGQMYGLLLLDGLTSKDMSLGAGITDVWFYETYPRYLTDEGQLIAREANWSRAQLSDFRVSLERNLERLGESILTDEWPARDGSWCATCPCPMECPIPEKLRDLPEILTVRHAEEAFSRKLALERESARVQKGLRGWTEENGAVYVGDLAFDAQTSEHRHVKDWDQLILSLLRTTEIGAPFEITDHVEMQVRQKFGKRKQTEEEQDDPH